jgi:hypothetical protein
VNTLFAYFVEDMTLDGLDDPFSEDEVKDAI